MKRSHPHAQLKPSWYWLYEFFNVGIEGVVPPYHDWEWPMCAVWQPFFSTLFCDMRSTPFWRKRSNAQGETNVFSLLCWHHELKFEQPFDLIGYLYRIQMYYENGPPMIKSPSSFTSGRTTLWYMLGVAPFQWETGNFLCFGSKISTKTSICLR